MNLILSVLLLLLGAGSTLAAFGGVTWKDNRQPLLRRITGRGWLALSCLFLALVLGVAKEWKEAQDSNKLKIQRDVANRRLDDLRTTLTTTQAQLSKQTEINLLTVLARDMPVKGVRWIIYTNQAEPIDDATRFMFTLIPAEFRELALVNVSFHPTPDVHSDAMFEPSQPKPQVTAFPSSENAECGFYTPPLARLNRFIPALIMSQEITENELPVSSAIAYGQLKRHTVVGEILLQFSKEFPSAKAADQFMSSHPKLIVAARRENPQNHHVLIGFQCPSKVAEAFLQFWRRTVLETTVMFDLRNRFELFMYSKAAITGLRPTQVGAVVEFSVTTDPTINVTTFEEPPWRHS